MRLEMNKKRLSNKSISSINPESKQSQFYFWLLLGLLIGVYSVGFYHDVRMRDSFTWMDPGEYYQFAASIIGTLHDNGQFNVPTIFPFFVAPFLLIGGSSIASALWVNILFLIVLCLALHRLSHQFEITFYPFLMIVATISSPLIIGLSRELYIELPLTAVSALIFSLWFDSRRKNSPWRTGLFAVAFGFGFMLKITLPFFFAGLLIVQSYLLLKSRKYWELLKEWAAFVVPVLIVTALTYLFFKQTFGYYTRIANTAIPVTKLLGPGAVFSLPSFFYYISVIWKTMLFLLTPLLLIPLSTKASRAALRDHKAIMLWAWLAAPLLLLTLVENKEPRHFAPCIVPVLMLLFKALSAFKNTTGKMTLGVVVFGLCTTQYLLVTNHVVVAPYYLNQASQYQAIQAAVKKSDPTWKQSTGDDASFREFCWLRTKNIVVMGFDPNMALSLAWNFRPAIVFDFDLFKKNPRRFNNLASHRFEDLFYYSSSSIYNRRCLCDNYFQSLDPETILTNADYVLVSLERANADGIQLSGFYSAEIFKIGSSVVQLLVANTASRQSYRAIYERELLRSGISFTPEDLSAIYFDLAVDDSLHQNFSSLNKIFQDYSLQSAISDNPSSGMRNIYWLADDIKFKEIMLQYLRRFNAQRLKSPEQSK